MNLLSTPVHSIAGEISVPGDKSISHRAIIFSALAEGVTTVDGILDGEDCIATLRAFEAMGVQFDGPRHQKLTVHGVGKYGLKKPTQVIDCGNSGTSMRLLAGLLAAQPFDSELTGDESLLKRPMLRISTPLIEMGAEISTHNGKAPLLIKGNAQSQLRGIEYVMPQASAQVKSCIILAALYAKGPTQIKEPELSRDHTERMLKSFSYPIAAQNGSISIDGMHQCIATHIKVPGDLSSAAFFIVAATIIPGADILITNVGINPTRTGILRILSQMGADISILNERAFGEEPVADLRIKHAPLKGIDIPSVLVPSAIDEFPIIFIAAACAAGQTTLHDAKELRLKESDRINVMACGLDLLGIETSVFDDGISITGGVIQGGVVESQGDHRVAMSFAVAGAVATSSVIIKNCAPIATSFPDFIGIANKLHFDIEELNNDK